MAKSLVIIGCGGFGREVHDVVDAINALDPTWELQGYVDDEPTEANETLVEGHGSRVLGTLSMLEKLPVGAAVVGIGSPVIRRAVDLHLQGLGWESAVLVHPTATIGHGTSLGPGTVICAGARLTTNITLGRHVHVDQNATIGHDTVIGDYARMNPQACVSGSVRLGEGVLVGASATVLQGLEVGAGGTLGAGSVVVKDVPAHVVVKGVPAA
jgi:sugar O-acyltransferase (sialic acid O-acetyltransferase NeuD family)